MTPSQHDTVRLWLSGHSRPRDPQQRLAWYYVRLLQRARRRGIYNAPLTDMIRQHLWNMHRDWIHTVATMLAGEEMRKSSIEQIRVRYRLRLRTRGRVAY